MTILTLRHSAILATGLVTASCATGFNYSDAEGPRYLGARPMAPMTVQGDTLRLASFNIEYGERIDSALAVLTETPELRDLDIVLLQEMDEGGTRRIARALGMGYVYYPATYRSGIDRDFGNAILTRWPVRDDAKLTLPHHSIFTGSQRTATAATVRVREQDVRVYSLHLGTVVNQWPWHRDDQLRTVLDDAERFPLVVLGGDMNSRGLGEMAVERGYSWPTRDGPNTVGWWRWDHIFVRGLQPLEADAAGTVVDNRNASDHRPVWARAVLPSMPPTL